MSKSITQDMAYRQSLMKYAEKYGVSRASRKYNKSRSYICFWKARWDGCVKSLACRSRRPHSLGLIELRYRLKKRGCTRFSNSKRDSMTLFEKTAADLGIRHRLIRPYTPRHNGKVERSHREDQKRFYSCHFFFRKTSRNNLLSITAVPTTSPCGRFTGFLLLTSFSNMFGNPTVHCGKSF